MLGELAGLTDTVYRSEGWARGLVFYIQLLASSLTTVFSIFSQKISAETFNEESKDTSVA